MAEEKVIIIKPRGNDIFIKEQQGRPVTIDPPKGGAVWGKLVGDINDQQDLMAKFAQMDAAIQEAKDWAVVGWVL